MKLYSYQFGKHRVRCQFDDADTARALWEQFVPMVLKHVFGMQGFDPDTTELPVLNGQGFVFRKQVLTAFGGGFEVVIVDSDGVKAMAKLVGDRGGADPN
jgi:hypothetical protein